MSPTKNPLTTRFNTSPHLARAPPTASLLLLQNESCTGERRACAETLCRSRSSFLCLRLSRSRRAKRAHIRAQKHRIRRNRPLLMFCKSFAFFVSSHGSMADVNDMCVVVGVRREFYNLMYNRTKSRPISSLESPTSPSTTQPSPLSQVTRLSSYFPRRTRGETQQ